MLPRCCALAALLALGACLAPGAQPCADGTVCPADAVCLPAGGCARPAQVDACGGLATGALCAVPGLFAEGVCVDGACGAPRCGDGVISATTGEACDDGAGNGDAPDAACRPNCQPGRCGDAIVDPARETCDDGNLASGDGCAGDCRSDETCGNEVADLLVGEQCDAGVSLSHDGCGSTCRVELPIWSQPRGVPRGDDGVAIGYLASAAQIVAFGGGGEQEVSGVGRPTWTWDGLAWRRRFTAHAPSLRRGATLAPAPGGGLILFGGDDETGRRDDTWRYDGVDWVELTPATRPPARSNHAAAFDPGRGRLVVFGGQGGAGVLDDTWEFDGLTWTAAVTAVRPEPRYQPALAYDPAGLRVILVGGGGDAEVAWAYDGDTWAPRPADPDLANHETPALAHDGARILLIGGVDNVLALDGDDWLVLPEAAPPYRDATTLVWDAARASFVSFGAKYLTDYYADTWVRGADGWSQAYGSTSDVPATADHQLGAEHPLLGLTLVVGGTFGGGEELWAYDGELWGRFPRPAVEFSALQLAYDVARRRLVLVGELGEFGGGPRRTWTHDGTAWAQLPGAAPAGASPRLAYDPVRGGVVWFDGVVTALLGDSAWATVPGAAPPARSAHVLATLPGGRGVMVFGGYAPDFTHLDDTWILDGDGWREVATSPAPAPRYAATAVLAATAGIVVLTGGGGNEGSLGDTWAFDGEAWRELSPVAVPPVRAFPALTPLGRSQEILLVGGVDGLNARLDAWRFEFASAGGVDERCRGTPVDLDGDGLEGCADPDCWGACDPLCPPSQAPATCAGDRPRCGDGACNVALEDAALCPGDCAT